MGGMMNEAEAKLLREINRCPGVHILVTMPATEAAGNRLIKMGLARRVRGAFVSTMLPQSDRLVCENHRDKAWPEECDCGPGMRYGDTLR